MIGMEARNLPARVRKAIAPIGMGLLLAGCTARHTILAVTETNIGVDVSQNPANQSPQAKLGYQRVELAIVPTNRSAGEDAGTTGHGATDHGDVIMELRYGGIFDIGESSGIYQRLAVGTTAVHEPGASVMFARNASGEVTAEAQQALKNVIAIQQTPPKSARDKFDQIAALNRCHAADIKKAAEKAGAGSFENVRDGNATDAQLDQILKDTESLAPCPNS
jgi:hypothetical protein